MQCPPSEALSHGFLSARVDIVRIADVRGDGKARSRDRLVCMELRVAKFGPSALVGIVRGLLECGQLNDSKGEV